MRHGIVIKKAISRHHLKDISYSVGGLITAPLLFKVLMDGAEIDTMVTSPIIRQELQELDVKNLKLNSNVTEFIEAVNANIKKLESRGEVASNGNLIMNIFKVLKVVQDKCFREYFTTFEYDWLSGRRPMTPKSLLNKGETFYKVNIQNKPWEHFQRKKRN